jgi:hypothetical protein
MSPRALGQNTKIPRPKVDSKKKTAKSEPELQLNSEIFVLRSNQQVRVCVPL